MIIHMFKLFSIAKDCGVFNTQCPNYFTMLKASNKEYYSIYPKTMMKMLSLCLQMRKLAQVVQRVTQNSGANDKLANLKVLLPPDPIWF
jgi:hypothetical protein